jgi:hypothetical protein
MSGADEIRWARRAEREKIRRLYTLDAKGLVDEELIDEVGYAMFARCESIRTVTEAAHGRVTCPRCRSIIGRVRSRDGGGKDQVLQCSCGWSATWGQYLKSYQGKQLMGGAAFPAFLEFLEAWPKARSPRDKLLLIDRLVHALHVNLIETKGLLFARSAAVNLIEGRLKDVNALLEELAYGERSTPELLEARDRWRATRAESQRSMARAWERRKAGADG